MYLPVYATNVLNSILMHLSINVLKRLLSNVNVSERPSLSLLRNLIWPPFNGSNWLKNESRHIHQNRKDYHLVIDNVPALICNQCGEPYFDESEVRLMQGLIKEVDKKTEEIHRLNVAV